jgi:regulator of protease activity HflC (stomatin/prohibitin superfamily)
MKGGFDKCEETPRARTQAVSARVKVPVQRQLKTELGFRTVSAGVSTQYAPETFRDESLMLTADLNVAVVEWTTQFRVSDPYQYLFKVRNLFDADESTRFSTFRDMNEAVVRTVIGDRPEDRVPAGDPPQTRRQIPVLVSRAVPDSYGSENSYTKPSFSWGSVLLSTPRSTIHRFI